MVRLAVAVVGGVGWLVMVPFVALALDRDGWGWASAAFVPVAVLTALAWWFHLRERSQRIGAGGAMVGWFFIGSLAVLAIAGFFWMLVAAAVLVSAAAYGIVLLVTRQRARRPGLELVTGLALVAAGTLPAAFTLIAGIGDTAAWWMPAHALLAVGISLATLLSGVARQGVSVR